MERFLGSHQCQQCSLSSIRLPHQVILGNRVAKTKLVEQLTLVTLQTAHHGSTSPMASAWDGSCVCFGLPSGPAELSRRAFGSCPLLGHCCCRQSATPCRSTVCAAPPPA